MDANLGAVASGTRLPRPRFGCAFDGSRDCWESIFGDFSCLKSYSHAGTTKLQSQKSIQRVKSKLSQMLYAFPRGAWERETETMLSVFYGTTRANQTKQRSPQTDTHFVPNFLFPPFSITLKLNYPAHKQLGYRIISS
jgi:hypothetical protein